MGDFGLRLWRSPAQLRCTLSAVLSIIQRELPVRSCSIFPSIAVCLGACGFAANYAVFLILRTIYGIGMGGEWGVGASLAMENAPAKWRGVLSGIVQSGYCVGYLLAAVAARFILPAWGWRAMFWAGGAPA